MHTQVGPFTLIDQIGLGGVAELWEAAHVDDGRRYAVKILRAERMAEPQQVKSLETEFAILEQVRHPALPVGRRWVEVAGRPAFVMDLIPGENLGTVFARKQKVDGLRCLRELADAADFLHGHDLVHNDIKLDNCILRPEGGIALVDLGNVRRIQWTNVITGIFRRSSGRIFGTPTYLAPELILGRKATVKTDVYALGVCAFLLITGRPPFIAATNDERLKANLSEVPPTLASRIPGIPVHAASVLDRCLAKKPQDRPDSAAEVRMAVEELLARVRNYRIRTPDPESLGRTTTIGVPRS